MKNPKKIWAVGIAALAVVLAIGAFGFYKKDSEKALGPQIYRNEAYGFEFSLPEGWIVSHEEKVEPNSHDEGIDFLVTVKSAERDEKGDSSVGRISFKKLQHALTCLDNSKYDREWWIWSQRTAYPGDANIPDYVGIENDLEHGRKNDPSWNRLNYSEKNICHGDDPSLSIGMTVGIDERFDERKRAVEAIAGSVRILTDADKSAGQIYENDEFGFTLRFPETWKGYRITRTEKVSGTSGGVCVGIQDQAEMFCITARTQDQWFSAQRGDLKPDRYLGSSGEHVYSWTSAQDYTDAALPYVKDVASIAWSFRSTRVSGVVYGWETYTNPEYGFEFQYPANFSTGVDQLHRYDFLIERSAPRGVAFRVPASFTSRTNLASDSYMAVERVDEGEHAWCSADDYMMPDPRSKAASVDIGGQTYSTKTSSGAGAGNFYQETVYVRNIGSKSCVIGRLFLHSNNLSVLQENNPRVTSYDKAELERLFLRMVGSIRIITDTTEKPVIESISSAKARTGSVIQLVGYNFAGFEGDLDAWIENSSGETAYMNPSQTLYWNEKYKEIIPGKEVIRVSLDARLCKVNNSYSGNPCESYMVMYPGKYKIFTRPWGKESNKVEFEVIL